MKVNSLNGKIQRFSRNSKKIALAIERLIAFIEVRTTFFFSNYISTWEVETLRGQILFVMVLDWAYSWWPIWMRSLKLASLSKTPKAFTPKRLHRTSPSHDNRKLERRTFLCGKNPTLLTKGKIRQIWRSPCAIIF